MQRLNVGCGADYREGWVNLDWDFYDKNLKADIYFDLNDIYKGKKLPFEENHFEGIIMYDVLEHFPEPLPILKELYRVCKMNGFIIIKVPCGRWVWDNLDHKHQFNFNSFNVANFNNYTSNDDKRVKIIYRKVYVMPSRNFLFKVLRYVFGKVNLEIMFKKIK